MKTNRYLFICIGNTNRSKTGEIVFRKMLREAGFKVGTLEDQASKYDFIVDSVGIAPEDGKRQFQTSMAKGTKNIFAADSVTVWYLAHDYGLRKDKRVVNLSIPDVYDVSIDWQRVDLEQTMRGLLRKYVPVK